MDKSQAIHKFWESFELPAYDEQNLPDDATMPYITYSVSTDSIGNNIALSANLWYRSDSWKDISQKADEIAEFIGAQGFRTIRIDNPTGYLYVHKGSPFAQRMGDVDSGVKRIYINITAEFLTAY